MEEKQKQGGATKWELFQVKAGKILDGTAAQGVIMALIVIDVVCVMMELLLSSTSCHDCTPYCGEHAARSVDDGQRRQLALSSGSTRFMFSSSNGHYHRHLGGAAPTEYRNSAIQCTNATNMVSTITQRCVGNAAQTDWNTALHSVSVGILVIFAIQLVLLMLVYQKKFFLSTGYVADTIVVGTALVLENLSSAKSGGLFVVLLSWRVLRIVHGVISSVELNHGMKHKDISKEALRFAKEIEGETRQLQTLVTGKLEEVLVQKDEAQMTVSRRASAADDAIMVGENQAAHDFVELYDFLASLNTQLTILQSKIDSHSEKHSEGHGHGAQEETMSMRKATTAVAADGTATSTSTAGIKTLPALVAD